MRVKQLFLFLLLFSPAAARAQWEDTLRRIFHGPVLPDAYFDTRNSYVSNGRAHIWGAKASVEFSGRIELGLGYNFLDQKITKEIDFTDANGRPGSAEARLHLAYISLYGRYVYYKKNHWTFSVMPVQLGFGGSKYKYMYNGDERITGKGAIVTYEPGISVSYRITWWIGAGGDIGYRYMLHNNPSIDGNFNSPIYTFYIIIYYADIYKHFFPGTKLAKML